MRIERDDLKRKRLRQIDEHHARCEEEKINKQDTFSFGSTQDAVKSIMATEIEVLHSSPLCPETKVPCVNREVAKLVDSENNLNRSMREKTPTKISQSNLPLLEPQDIQIDGFSDEFESSTFCSHGGVPEPAVDNSEVVDTTSCPISPSVKPYAHTGLTQVFENLII